MKKTSVRCRVSGVGLWLVLFLLAPGTWNPTPAFSQVTYSGSVTSTGTVGAQTGEIFWEDDFEGNDLNAKWENGTTPGPDGFVWDCEAWSDECWKNSTSAAYAGTYGARARFANDGNLDSPLAAPTMGQTAGGALGAHDVFCKQVIVRPNTPTGKRNIYFTSEANVSVSANNLATATSPAAGQTFYSYDMYCGSVTGDSNLKLQNTTPISVGANWTEDTGGLQDNGAYPVSFTEDTGSLTRQFARWPAGTSGIGNELYQSGRVRISSAIGGSDETLQIKLMRMYENDEPSDSCGGSCFELILTVNDTDGTGSTMTPGNQGDGCSALNAFTTTEKITYDTWHFIVMYAKLNDVGSSNGVVRLWFDGTQVGENTAFAIRCTDSAPFGGVEWGNQVQASGSPPAQEKINKDIDWDDVKATNFYVGP